MQITKPENIYANPTILVFYFAHYDYRERKYDIPELYCTIIDTKVNLEIEQGLNSLLYHSIWEQLSMSEDQDTDWSKKDLVFYYLVTDNDKHASRLEEVFNQLAFLYSLGLPKASPELLSCLFHCLDNLQEYVIYKS